MGRLKKCHERQGSSSQGKSVIIVPGVSAQSLEEQTCIHFHNFVETQCAAPNTRVTVWVYDHAVTPQTPQCWTTFCDAGVDLLQGMLDLIQRQPEVDLILIGHRLGAFILKKALILAHRKRHQDLPNALFESLQTIVMIADPCLHNENRSEWARLVQDCLQHSKASPEAFSETALSGLPYIYEAFEEVTLQSQFFQVSGKPPVKKKLLRPKTKTKYKNCVCDANITVRMWTTADDDDMVPESDGDNKRCVWHEQSNFYHPLALITTGEFRTQPLNLLTHDGGEEASNSSAPVNLFSEAPSHEGSGEYNDKNDPSPSIGVFTIELETPDAEAHDAIPSECKGTMQNPDIVAPAIDLEENPTINRAIRDDYSPATNSKNNRPTQGETYTPARSQDGYRYVHEQSGASDIALGAGKGNQRCTEDTLNGTGKRRLRSFRTDSSTKSIPSDQLHTSRLTGARTNNGNARPSPIEARPRPLPLQLRVPPPCGQFVGRQGILESLRDFFFVPLAEPMEECVTGSKQRRAVLCGKPGIGKTEVAREFARHYANAFESIFWIKSDSPWDVARSFHDIAIALGLINGRRQQNHSHSATLCKQWLEHTRSPQLLVFNDVEQFETVKTYVPTTGKCSVIFTTQLSTADEFESSHATTMSLVVEPFDDNETREYLSRALQLPRSMFDADGFQKVVNILGGLPLALMQFVRYAKTRETSWQRVISDCESTASRILAWERAWDVHRSPRIPPIIACLIRLEDLSLRAAEFCSVLACLDASELNDSLILAARQSKIPLKNFPSTKEELDAAKEDTVTHAIISGLGDGNDRFCMNKVIQKALQETMREEQKIDAFVTASACVRSRWPSRRRFKNCVFGFWPEFDTIHSHVHNLGRLGLSWFWDGGNRSSFTNETFSELLSLSTWYNFRVRGNWAEDTELIELTHTLYASSSHSDPAKLSPSWKSPHMPRRLLFIDHRQSSWRLVETNGRPTDYMCLSWFWGSNTRVPKLTKSNLSAFLCGLPISELPSILQDACLFLEQADCNYLWFDGMCIVQDDETDLIAESYNLYDIYRSAIATMCPRFDIKSRNIQEQSRRLSLGPYTLMSHRSETFSQIWFPRIMARSIETVFGGTEERERSASKKRDSTTNFVLTLPLDTMKLLWGTFSLDDGEASTETTAAATPTSRMQDPIDTKTNHGGLSSENNQKPKGWQREQRSPERVADAKRLLDEGLGCLKQRNILQAVGSFIEARDCVTILASTSSDALQSHILSSIYLARVYLKENTPKVSHNLLRASDLLMEGQSIVHDSLQSTRDRFYLIKGDVQRTLGNNEEAIQTYQLVAQISEAQGDRADLAAIAKLKLSEIFITNSRIREAHNLVDETITRFQRGETSRAQGQYARALYYQALAFEAEHNNMLKKRKIRDARQALEDLCEEQGLPTPPSDRELIREDFEEVLEIDFL